jgi:hypothetical protein
MRIELGPLVYLRTTCADILHYRRGACGVFHRTTLSYPLNPLLCCVKQNKNKQANYTDRRFSETLVLTFGDRGCHVASVTDPYGRILGFLDRIALRNIVFVCLIFSEQTTTISQNNMIRTMQSQ